MFTIKISTEDILNKFQNINQNIIDLITREMESLSHATFTQLIYYIQNKLHGTYQSMYLGENNKNVRWNKISDNKYEIEVDESVRWLEEGRNATSMATEAWLLKPNKSKISKTGTIYRYIPLKLDILSPKTKYPEIREILKEELRKRNIPITKPIYRDGVLLRGKITETLFPNLKVLLSNKSYAKKLSGLETKYLSKSGTFWFEKVNIYQHIRVTPKKEIAQKTALVFRTVSSKHKSENKWVYPPVPAANLIPMVYEWAVQEWTKRLTDLENKFANL